jgi:PAS domain S-box-containing protein
MAEAIPQIVWTAHADGVVDYFNRRWFEYTGMSHEATAGSWEAAVHPIDLPRCRKEWREALRTGAMLELECRLKRGSDDAYHWHLCRATPEHSMTGAVVSWFGTFTDIEDQKRAQAALAELKGILDAVLDAVLIFDPDDLRLLYVNQGASALLGYPTRQLAEMRPFEFLTGYDEPTFRELLATLGDGSQALMTLETQVRRRDARTVPVDVSLQLIRIDGTRRVVSIARDMTDRQQAQLERELLYREAVDAIRARNEFLSIASHELRTPLSSLSLQVDAFMRAIRKDPMALAPENVTARLEKVGRQVERLSRLISELMDVTKITQGQLRLQREEIDLSTIARDIVGRFSEEAQRAQSPVEIVVGAPVLGMWDRLRVEQVTTNLLSNALKFGAGRPIEMIVEEHGDIASLTVRDHGVGIAPEDVERIFDRFEQAPTARVLGGLGLGLYIARQIVEAHGGTIRVESQLGAGSTFTVELPRSPPAAISQGAGERETQEAAEDRPG